MYLERLNIINFKNIASASLTFGDKLNCFTGDNGAGKTNLLDAVHYLSLGKSALQLTDRQCMRRTVDFFMVDGVFRLSGDRMEKVVCSYTANGGKVLKRNDKEYAKLLDHVGLFPSVLVSPADTVLIQAGEERRRYVNALLSQLDREYLTTLVRYNNVLSQRNRLLKGPLDGASAEILDILDAQLCGCGQVIYEKRKELIGRLAPVAADYYRRISDGREPVELTYESALSDAPFGELLKAARTKDGVNGFTSVGVHRDDVGMFLQGHPIRKFGSQGQQKSFLIALKLAQFDLIAERKGMKPLLLLDDIFDKLDMQRVENLIALVSQEKFGQIFITDANKVRLASILDRIAQNHRLFDVEGGEVSPGEPRDGAAEREENNGDEIK